MSEVLVPGDHGRVELAADRGDQRVDPVQVWTIRRNLVRDVACRDGRSLVDRTNVDPRKIRPGPVDVPTREVPLADERLGEGRDRPNPSDRPTPCSS